MSLPGIPLPTTKLFVPRVRPDGTTARTWLDAPAADIEAVLTTLVNDAAALPPLPLFRR